MEALLGPKLLHGSQEVATSSLERGVVGLYFSAHWCGPCRNYTPQFRKVYERARAAGRAFEVVFISSDHDEASFRSYFSGMPWHAVPFSDRLRQQQLSSVFKVQGIPSLILLDANGQVWNPNARGTVMQPSFLGSLPRRVDLEAQRLPQPEEAVPICVRHKGREMEIECEPGEGWEILRMQIFSLTEVPEEQMKLFGLGLDQGLLDDSVPLPVALARARAAARGSGLRLAKVPPERRRASSTHNAEKIAAQHGTLESGTAWGANKEDQTSWYQLDLGAVQDVSGVLVASRVDCPQWITRFRVALADVEEGPWAHADGGREFDGPSLLASTRAVFHCSKRARFVRIEPLSFKGHCSLRADVLLADGAEPDKPTLVVLGNFSAGDPFEITEAKPDAMVEEQHLAFLQAKLSAMPAKLQSQAGQLQMVQRYELWDLQRQALEEIPVCGIDAGIDGSESHCLEASESGFERKGVHEVAPKTDRPGETGDAVREGDPICRNPEGLALDLSRSRAWRDDSAAMGRRLVRVAAVAMAAMAASTFVLTADETPQVRQSFTGIRSKTRMTWLSRTRLQDFGRQEFMSALPGQLTDLRILHSVMGALALGGGLWLARETWPLGGPRLLLWHRCPERFFAVHAASGGGLVWGRGRGLPHAERPGPPGGLGAAGAEELQRGAWEGLPHRRFLGIWTCSWASAPRDD
ncbi:unnamed protein product [Effrenium voratum]|uniref:protein-disulfide reductase n=1 Tax=Effrenium voratum TaxID=2562239 RepID=A0AA36NCA1_9DINO|nr:unnamed protein product [Effrenium voratum]